MSDNKYSHNKWFYVHGSLRRQQKCEFYLMPGEYELENGQGSILILNISLNDLKKKEGTLINRAKPIVDEIRVNI